MGHHANVTSFKKGHRQSVESRKKMSLAKMGHPPWNKGKHGVAPDPWNKNKKIDRNKYPNMGHFKKHSKESRKKMVETHTKNPLRYWLGKHRSEETKKKLSTAFKGENGPGWKGGISFFPYPTSWTKDLKESIRKRDYYTCQLCGRHQSELKTKLAVHHIDYKKDNVDPNNLITLCRGCHAKTNFNRKRWMFYFKGGEI